MQKCRQRYAAFGVAAHLRSMVERMARCRTSYGCRLGVISRTFARLSQVAEPWGLVGAPFPA